MKMNAIGSYMLIRVRMIVSFRLGNTLRSIIVGGCLMLKLQTLNGLQTHKLRRSKLIPN